MQLVIVESPAKAKTINKYLGSDYKVLASFGHIRDLPSKDGSVLPDQDFKMLYEISRDSERHVREIATAAKAADSIFLATDPDREGEAISWHLMEALRERNAIKRGLPVRRVVFHEITKTAVLKAMQAPRDVDMNLVCSQQARRALDYLVGFNLSPILWRKLPGSRSAGRVQSVALRLICEREDEIERFKPREYWSIAADFGVKKGRFTAKLSSLKGEKLEQFSLSDKGTADDALAFLEHLPYRVADVQTKRVQRHPKPPFTTSTLQQEAARKLGFGAKRTMQTAQKLYEGFDVGGETVGLITYMRTDAVTVSKEAVFESRDLIKERYGAAYVPDSPRMYKTKTKNAQEAHEAIRPTSLKRTPESLRHVLDRDYLALYELIWKRMTASQMASAELDQTTVTVEGGQGQAQFRATGTVIYFDGFLKLYREGVDDEAEEEDKLLPGVTPQEPAKMDKLGSEQHFTQPPPRYTEASLVKSLEELGIGRPSTYASIISVLQDRNYVKLDKKRFVAEERGRLVTSFLTAYFGRYVEYDFTAKLEEELDDIADGQRDWKEALRAFWSAFRQTVEAAGEVKTSAILDELNAAMAHHLFPKDADGVPQRGCPECKTGELSLKVGKFGAFLGCSRYPECKHTKRIGEQDAQQGEDGEPGAGGDLPKILGKDPETGLDVILKKGPYGLYVQLGEGAASAPEPAPEPEPTPAEPEEAPAGKGKRKAAAKKPKAPKAVKAPAPKRASLPKGATPANFTLEQALSLLALPRHVGDHPETGEPITASLGRFGPYIKYGPSFISLKEDNVLTVGLNRAVSLIADYETKHAGDRRLGKHPVSGEDLSLKTGRYGKYLKAGKRNIKIPKEIDPETLTLAEAIELAGAGAPPPAEATGAKAGAKSAAKSTTSRKKAAAPEETLSEGESAPWDEAEEAPKKKRTAASKRKA